MASTSYLKNAPLKDKMPETWDVEVCHEGEADLYKHHKSCQKHPDHKEFIPVDKFDITHLPTDYQDRDIVEYIKLVAQLTVRLTVRYVSPYRPANVPGTDTPYPFYENRGQNFMRVGTGLITEVFINKIDEIILYITTATHVVFDKQEAETTTSYFFYNDGNQPKNCQTAVELKSSDVDVFTNTITDQSFFRFETCDQSLQQKLKSIFLKLLELRKIIKEKLIKLSSSSHNQPLTFIVSHPHGCSKKISIGRCVEVDDNLNDVRFLYTTPTCPGSSGAAVICLDEEAWKLNTIHSGTWKEDTALNLSSGRYYPSPVSFLGSRGVLTGPGNPNERLQPDFRMRETWSNLLSLPPEFSCNLMVDYLTAWSYLCADVHVKYVSEQRPEFWPGSQLPYPWYKKRGGREERLGCGWVDRVDIYRNESSPSKTCDCDKCRNSSTPEREFAHIYILTSTSLVFDQSEGQATLCTLPNFSLKLGVKRLQKLGYTQPVSSNIETDRSQLVFVTHSLILAEKYETSLEHVSFLKEKIQDKFSYQLSDNPISIKTGRSGVIRLGKCVKVDKHLVYTNEAEQDDVGAPVIVLGNKHLHVDVSGHTGEYPQDTKLRYSRYLDYQYKQKLISSFIACNIKNKKVDSVGSVVESPTLKREVLGSKSGGDCFEKNRALDWLI